jgi:2-amino-4-hydroxy-6-hydroxymethyldihydropteridine diphosphokinase
VVDAYVGLGSNLDGPIPRVREAIARLDGIRDTRLVAASSLYASAPVGYADQPDFVNAVARVSTDLSPRELLEALLDIERAQGRRRDFPNAPRTLDLDLLLYGDAVVHEEGLCVPHPRMVQRAFVLAPLFEISPSLAIPGVGGVAGLMAGVADQAVARLETASAAPMCNRRGS